MLEIFNTTNLFHLTGLVLIVIGLTMELIFMAMTIRSISLTVLGNRPDQHQAWWNCIVAIFWLVIIGIDCWALLTTH